MKNEFILLFLILWCSVSGTESPNCSLCRHGSPFCRIVSGIFMKPRLNRGYNKVTDVPAGACSLRVTQITRSSNKLGLRRSGGDVMESNDSTLITMDGPLPYPVEIVVLIEETNRGIQYEYSLPVQSSNSNDSPPSSPLLPRAPQVQEAQGSSTTLNQLPKVKKKGRRNRHKGKRRNRKFKWSLTGYGPCDATCGEGAELALFQCIREGRKKKVVKERRCRKVGLPSAPFRPCQGLQPCPPQREESKTQHGDSHKPPTGQWNIGPWSKCSTKCGEGIKTRSVDCVSIRDGDVIPETECNGPQRPATLSTCNGNECHLQSPQWMYTEWEGDCDPDKGASVEQRDAACSGEACTGSPKKTRPCNRVTGAWFTGAWSPCSVTCDKGVQHRAVLCMKEPELTSQPESRCNATSKPSSIQRCSVPATCPSRWFTSQWTKCENASCYQRQVLCFDSSGNISQGCPRHKKPSTEIDCNTASCDHIETQQSLRSHTRSSQATHSPRHSGDAHCRDHKTECKFVVNARLCPLEFYRRACCASCKNYKPVS